MYIELSGVRHPCTGTPTLTGETLRLCLPGGGENAELAAMTSHGPTGTVRLCADDGFVLREIDVSGYLRWGMEGETLVVSNLPKPEPVEPEPSPVAEIAVLKSQLEATDYKIIKCSEYRLAGIEGPYDIAALHMERQALRDEINRLEGGAWTQRL